MLLSPWITFSTLFPMRVRLVAENSWEWLKPNSVDVEMLSTMTALLSIKLPSKKAKQKYNLHPVIVGS